MANENAIGYASWVLRQDENGMLKRRKRITTVDVVVVVNFGEECLEVLQALRGVKQTMGPSLVRMDLDIESAAVEGEVVGDVAEVDAVAEEIFRIPARLPRLQELITRPSFQLYLAVRTWNLEKRPLLLQ
jgi:hypothetical protein